MKFKYLNCQGLKSKLTQLLAWLYEEQSIFLLVETWLDMEIELREIPTEHWNIWRRDRNKRGGGLVIIAPKSLRLTNFHAARDLEACTIELSRGRKESIIICLAYLPPPVEEKDVERLSSFLEQTELFNINGSVKILIGDLNIPEFSRIQDHPTGRSLLLTSLIEYYNLRQRVCDPTRGLNILDLVFTELPCVITVSNAVIPSDHKMIEVCLNLKHHLKPRLVRNFNAVDWRRVHEGMESFLSSKKPFGPLSDDDLKLFLDKCNDCLLQNTPLVRSTTFPQWVSEETRQLQRDNLRALMVCRRIPSVENLTERFRLRKLFHQNFILDREKALQDLAEEKSGGQKFWRKTQELGFLNKERSKPGFSYTPGMLLTFENYYGTLFSHSCTNEKIGSNRAYPDNLPSLLRFSASDVQSAMEAQKSKKIGNRYGCGPAFFARLSRLLTPLLLITFNWWIEKPHYPNFLKISYITPVFKGGGREDPGNYRPIATVHPIALVFESLIANTLKKHYSALLTLNQHAFIHRRSTTTNLVEFWDFVTASLDAVKPVHVISCDLRKAFDSICHKKLLGVLQDMKINGDVYNFIVNYLSDRTCVIGWQGRQSNFVNVQRGIPQGSALGPGLFNLYMDSLSSLLISESIRHLLYADDLKLFSQVSCRHDMHKLQQGLTLVWTWCEAMCMTINTDKSFAVVLKGRILAALEPNYLLGGKFLNIKEQWIDLGIIFSTDSTFNLHYENIIKKASRTSGFLIRMTKGLRNNRIFIGLYYTLVRPILEYGCEIWNPWQQSWSHCLERIQNRVLKVAASRVLGWPVASAMEVSEIRQEMNVVDLQSRRLIAILRMGHRILSGKIDSSEMVSRIYFSVPASGLRVARSFREPPAVTNRRKTSFLLTFINTVNMYSIDFTKSENEFLKDVNKYLT